MSDSDRDDLERQLAELFQHRAATVTRTRQFDLGPGAGPRTADTGGPGRDRRRWQHLGVLAAAAAVFVAVVGTIVTIQGSRPRPAPPLATATRSTEAPAPSATPTPGARPCTATLPASWQSELAAGGVPVDRRLNAVLSADGSTGDYLVVQGNQPPPSTPAVYSDVEVALFHGRIGQTIYTPADSTDIPAANPTGAITADWVAFSLAHPQNLSYTYKVMLYDRRSGRATVLADAPDQLMATGRSFIGSPVIAAGRVYWLSTTFNKPATTTLDSWDLARGARAGSVPAAHATELIGYGSGMLVSYGYDDLPDYPVQSRSAMRNGAGTPLTKAQLAAAARGTNFGYDGAGTLAWLRHDGNAVGYSSVRVGAAGVRNDEAFGDYAGSGATVFPFVRLATGGLVDLRTRTLVQPPEGVALQAVAAPWAVFGTGTTKAGAAGLSLAPLSGLAAADC